MLKYQAAARNGRILASLCSRAPSRVHRRIGQAHRDRGAFAQRRFQHRLAAMHRRQRLDQRQAQAGAFLGAGLRRFPPARRAGPAFPDRPWRCRCRYRAPRSPRPLPSARRRDPHLAAARGEFDAVGEKIDQDLLDRALVGEDRAARRARSSAVSATPRPLRRQLDEAHAPTPPPLPGRTIPHTVRTCRPRSWTCRARR